MVFRLFGKSKENKPNTIKETNVPKLEGTIFIKDFSKDNKQLAELERLSGVLKEGWKKVSIDRDIRFAKYGLEGENSVYFELKNSLIPMYCLHDVRIEYDGNGVQYDFIVITSNCIYVIETKNLIGNIKITKYGEFIRQISTKDGYKEEGMYSPIAQNERHCNILQELIKLNNPSLNCIPIKSMVVMSNPKTVINRDEAPEDIIDKIYRVDQIIEKIKENITKLEINYNDTELLDLSNHLNSLDRPIIYDNVSKYSLTECDYKTLKKDSKVLYEELKEYRLTQSRKENIKAYYIFNNAELEELIEIYPKTKEDLLKVKGFGKRKVGKYGDDILSYFKNK